MRIKQKSRTGGIGDGAGLPRVFCRCPSAPPKELFRASALSGAEGRILQCFSHILRYGVLRPFDEVNFSGAWEVPQNCIFRMSSLFISGRKNFAKKKIKSSSLCFYTFSIKLQAACFLSCQIGQNFSIRLIIIITMLIEGQKKASSAAEALHCLFAAEGLDRINSSSGRKKMASKHVNRQATRRISIPVTVCLTLLASCTGKPIEQDLASGDATVEIKFLDSMTVDIIDDIRMKRRDFYGKALENENWKKEYPQGTQGAIDREATIAAAINANAQRDKSVLERYIAEGSRQLSAIENSEELGEEVLEHNKKIISQTNEINDAKVKAVESQAETLAELNKAKVKAVETLVEEYNKRVEIIDHDIKLLQEELAGQNAAEKKSAAEMAELDKKITNRASETANVKIWEKEKLLAEKNKSDAAGKITEIEGKIKALRDERTAAYDFLAKIFQKSTGGPIEADTGLIKPNDFTKPGMDLSLFNRTDAEFKDAGITYRWVEETGTKGTPGYKPGHWVPAEKKEINITQHPQAPVPDVPQYLTETLGKLDELKAKIEKFAKAESDNAINNTKDKVLAPPIERIRNDEAVLDYLLDGYRDTQISSGAEYGGMVRRVLPFSFVFTPGSSTQSGFGARVVLKPDQEQIDEAVAVIKQHFEHMNHSRTVGYMQLYAQAEKESGQLARNLLLAEYDGECTDVTSALQHQTNFNKKFDQVFEGDNKLKKTKPQQFWNAYGASLEALVFALKNSHEESQRISNARYTYDLSKVMSKIKSSIEKVGELHRIAYGSPQSVPTDMALERQDFHDASRAAAYASCVASKRLNIENPNIVEAATDTSDKKKKKRDHHIALKKLLEEINQLVMAMTSAGLVHEAYLQDSPKYYATGTKGKTIEVVESGFCSNPNAGRCYQAITKEFPYGDLEQEVENNAQVRIVQNTSREHVVEIADTAKMNTLLAAAATANEVSNKLGLNIGGEIAAALSSASAFIKRIPYAVPFTGQSFSASSPNTSEDENQSFGWKFYKTPSGATQMGRVAHSFKTTPLNSAVVVSMPEWMSKLTAVYEISPDGKNWEPKGKENITLSGASARSRINGEVKSKPFNTWVQYNIYQDGDASIGLPKLTSCYGNEKVIFSNSTGETAICGENLYGVKGILIGGKFIDEEIEKISNNLIKLKKIDIKPEDCPSLSNSEFNFSECQENSKCRVVLLSDFGATNTNDHYCLEIRQEPKAVPPPIPDKPDIPNIVKLEVKNATDGTRKGSNDENTFKFAGTNDKVKVQSYGIGKEGNYTDYHHTLGFTLKNYDLVKEYCMINKELRSCTIPVHGNVEITFEHIGSKKYSEQLGSIDLYQLGIWKPYPVAVNGSFVQPEIDAGAICETGATQCSFQIKNVSWDIGKPYSLLIGEQKIYDIANGTGTITCTETGWNVTCSATREKFKTWCGGAGRICPIGFRYQYHDNFEDIGEIKIKPDPATPAPPTSSNNP